MTAALIAGLAAGYGIAIPVGAIGILLVELAARTSPRVATAAGFGVATADGCYALLAVLGGAALARFITSVAAPLRLTAAGVLIALALRMAWSAWRSPGLDETAGGDLNPGARAGGLTTRRSESPRAAYARFLGITLLNPMTIVYFAALVVGSRAADPPSLISQAVFVVAVFLASSSWQLVLAAGGCTLGKIMGGQGGRRATATVASVLTIALGVRFLCG